MHLKLAALLICGAVALSTGLPSSRLQVLSKPDYLHFDASAGVISDAEVSSVVLTSMGLNTQLGWTGMATSSAFDQPRATILLVVDGCNSAAMDLSAWTVGMQSRATSALSAVTADTLEVAVKHVHGLDVVAMDQKAVSALARLNGVSLDSATNTLVVDGVELDLQQAELMALAQELSGLVAMAFSAEKHQLAVVELSALRPVMERHTANPSLCDAAMALVTKTLAAVKTNVQQAHGDQALVLVAEVHPEPEVTRARRSADAVGAAEFGPMDTAFVEHCEVYNCYCNKDQQGEPYDLDTRCSKSCTDDKPCFDCAYVPCDCNATTRLIKSSATCKQCTQGYVVHGNHCYRDTDFPVATNIILIVGVLLIVALLVTCNALDMDPGRESIIYRMTSTHMKSQ